MNRNRHNQTGFTLIEIAIVLLVVTILLGYGVAMFPVQQELKQYRNAESEMESIVEHLVAFAQVNGRLPCPDTAAAVLDGLEDRVGINACTAYFGFLPARTLGIDGSYDQNNVLIDPWGSGYGYAISNANDGAGNFYLVNPNGIRTAGMGVVGPSLDLYLCADNAALTNDLTCATTTSGAAGEILGSNGEVAAVIISLGRDNAIPATSNIQAENLDDFDVGTNDKVYIYSSRREDYDDIVKWVPTNLLFSRMIAAEQLP